MTAIAFPRRPRPPRMILSPQLQRAIYDAVRTPEQRNVALVRYDPEFAAFQARWSDPIQLAFARMQMNRRDAETQRGRRTSP